MINRKFLNLNKNKREKSKNLIIKINFLNKTLIKNKDNYKDFIIKKNNRKFLSKTIVVLFNK